VNDGESEKRVPIACLGPTGDQIRWDRPFSSTYQAYAELSISADRPSLIVRTVPEETVVQV